MPIKKPIIIKDWKNGIAPSPFEGISDMRNMDIASNPDSIQLAFRLQQSSPTAVSTTFTADAGTNIITTASTLRYNNTSATKRAVVFSTTNTLPSPLVVGTIYYLIDVSSTSFKVATTLDNADAGTEINIADAGTGVHTITSVNMRTPTGFAEDKRSGYIYLLDSIGQVWEATDIQSTFYLITGNTLTNATGNGIAVWKNYLIVFRNHEIDTWGSLLSARSSRVWYTLSTASAGYVCNQSTGTSGTHKIKIMSNDILYFADRDVTTGTPYIGSISEIPTYTFAPATTGTYNFTNSALDLPKYEYITDLAEYGNLMISTVTEKIYPWDTISDSFNDPIISPEVGVNSMTVVNNLLYFTVAKTGNIYFTQGTSNCQKVVDLPVYLTHTDIMNVDVNYMIPYCNGLLFTVNEQGGSTYSINAVWYYDLDLKALNIKNQYSTGSYSTTTSGALFTSGGTPYLAGWNISTTSWGVDGNHLTYLQRCTGYTGYVESGIYQIGTSLYPTNLSRISFELAKPLTAGQGIKLEQRQTLADSYTTIGTYDYSTYGAIQKFDDIPNVDNAQTVQIRISLTALVSTISITDTPQLTNVTLQ